VIALLAWNFGRVGDIPRLGLMFAVPLRLGADRENAKNEPVLMHLRAK
jgi:hypothetical protein